MHLLISQADHVRPGFTTWTAVHTDRAGIRTSLACVSPGLTSDCWLRGDMRCAVHRGGWRENSLNANTVGAAIRVMHCAMVSRC